MTMVPRTGPRSASSARRTSSLYQAEKSSLWGVTPRSLPLVIFHSYLTDAWCQRMRVSFGTAEVPRELRGSEEELAILENRFQERYLPGGLGSPGGLAVAIGDRLASA